MNDQDHSLSLSDPDRSLVLSHLLVNFLKNLVSCQTSLRELWTFKTMTPADNRDDLVRRIVAVCEQIPPQFLLNAAMGVSGRC
jgi:hypothetical protein